MKEFMTKKILISINSQYAKSLTTCYVKLLRPGVTDNMYDGELLYTGQLNYIVAIFGIAKAYYGFLPQLYLYFTNNV